MSEDTLTDTKTQIPTNLRLLLIVEEVARAGVPVLPAALSEALGLPKPTIHRLLATAEEEGFVQRDVDGRSYGPGKRMRRLAGNTLSSQRVRTERLIIMRDLAEKVEETCNLAAPGRYGMVYLDRVETHWPLRIELPIGTQVPFHCTASGKLYLSSLRPEKLERLVSSLSLESKTPGTITRQEVLLHEVSSIRSLGYATDREEFMEGMAAIAAPILDSRGRLLTTLSIHAPVQRHKIESLIEKLPQLQEAVKKLAMLGLD